jgi:pimeloyl-ACP methyl ester carboxylesterase
MYINRYGKIGAPVVVLLAPMMVSGSDLYELMGPYFTGEYCIIAPDQGGHGKSGAYISADEEYRFLKEFFQREGIEDIHLVYGASLGVAVAYRLFLDPDFDIAYAWFDGVALTENAGFAEWFMKKLFRSRKKKLEKTHVEASESLVKMYGYDFARMMTKNFERITIDDIDAICHACCHYDLRKLTEEEQMKLHLDFGEKDFDLRYSKNTIPVYMPKAEVTIRKGYAHCGYMAAKPAEYVRQIEEFIR